MDREVWICDRLRKMGYAKGEHIRLYGEEWELVSNPSAESAGFMIDGIIRKKAHCQRIHIPLMIVRILEQDLEIEQGKALAA